MSMFSRTSFNRVAPSGEGFTPQQRVQREANRVKAEQMLANSHAEIQALVDGTDTDEFITQYDMYINIRRQNPEMSADEAAQMTIDQS